MKPKFHSVKNALKTNADYIVTFGERSNGKTHSILELGLFGMHEDGIDYNGYLDDGSQMAIIRRWDEDFKGKYGSQQFEGFVNNIYLGNILQKRTKGKWNAIEYYSGKWYLKLVDEKGEVISKDETPFCYAFSLTSDEHYKSIAYPKITTILFDEFLTRKYYLPDEFIKFTSILSTIIRLRDNVKIFMCGNTVNKFCPYFAEMGLKHVKTQKKNTIDVYNYGDSGLSVAVEYTGDVEFQKMKPSNKYFAFDNSKLKMVTSGEWELNIYPHLPYKYNPKDILYTYYIIFDNDMLQCEIITINNTLFTYVHRKTSKIKSDNRSMVYQQNSDPRSNYRKKINKPVTKIEKKIAEFFIKDKVFYQDNEVGEIMRNYLTWCKHNELIN